MRGLNFLFFVVICIFSSLAIAEGSDTSGLEPGTRIVAGDLSQNEFYILGANEQVPLPSESQVASKAKHTIVADAHEINRLSKKITKAIQVAVNRHQKEMNKIVAQKKERTPTVSHLANKTTATKMKLALQHLNKEKSVHKSVSIASKKTRSTNKIALHQKKMRDLALNNKQ